MWNKKWCVAINEAQQDRVRSARKSASEEVFIVFQIILL